MKARIVCVCVVDVLDTAASGAHAPQSLRLPSRMASRAGSLTGQGQRLVQANLSKATDCTCDCVIHTYCNNTPLSASYIQPVSDLHFAHMQSTIKRRRAQADTVRHQKKAKPTSLQAQQDSMAVKPTAAGNDSETDSEMLPLVVHGAEAYSALLGILQTVQSPAAQEATNRVNKPRLKSQPSRSVLGSKKQAGKHDTVVKQLAQAAKLSADMNHTVDSLAQPASATAAAPTAVAAGAASHGGHDSLAEEQPVPDYFTQHFSHELSPEAAATLSAAKPRFSADDGAQALIAFSDSPWVTTVPPLPQVGVVRKLQQQPITCMPLHALHHHDIVDEARCTYVQLFFLVSLCQRCGLYIKLPACMM